MTYCSVLLFRHYKPRYKLNLYRIKAAIFFLEMDLDVAITAMQLRGQRCNNKWVWVVLTGRTWQPSIASAMHEDPVTATQTPYIP